MLGIPEGKRRCLRTLFGFGWELANEKMSKGRSLGMYVTMDVYHSIYNYLEHTL